MYACVAWLVLYKKIKIYIIIMFYDFNQKIVRLKKEETVDSK